jgi:hypothetical protein
LSIGYVLKEEKEQECLPNSSFSISTIESGNTKCIKPEINRSSLNFGLDYKLYKHNYFNLEFASIFFIGKTDYSSFFFSIVDSSISILREENWEYMGEFIIRSKPIYKFLDNQSIFLIADIGLYTKLFSEDNKPSHERIVRLYPYYGFGIGYKYKKLYINTRRSLFERTSINIGWYII